MKKTRTIEMNDSGAYYRGAFIGYIVGSIKKHFGLPHDGKVRIIIGGEGPYRFTLCHMSGMYEIHKDSEYIGVVCSEEFERLFFKPHPDKGYDIIVKEVK